MSKNDTDRLEWCGYTWKASMEGGRRIHPSYPWYWYSMDCTEVDESGYLHIFSRYNPKEIKHWDGKIYKPTIEVGTLRTIESFEYGTFSAEILMPKGKWISSSFWLSGAGNWPPEIDIEEGWIEDKGTYYRTRTSYFPWFSKGWHTTNNVHYRNNNMKSTHTGSHDVPIKKQPNDPAEIFVEYKCIWEPDCIRFYTDGTLTRTIGKGVSRKMRTNLEHPEKGARMNVIFNVWTENPEVYDVSEETDMCVRNFKYEPLKA